MNRRKNITWLLVCLWVLFAGCQPADQPKSFVQKADTVLAELEQIKNAPDRQDDYLKVIEKLMLVAAQTIKDRPDAYSNFLQDTVDIAAKTNPGLSLRVESYASEKLLAEMEQLRKDSADKRKELDARVDQEQEKAEDSTADQLIEALIKFGEKATAEISNNIAIIERKNRELAVLRAQLAKFKEY